MCLINTYLIDFCTKLGTTPPNSCALYIPSNLLLVLFRSKLLDTFGEMRQTHHWVLTAYDVTLHDSTKQAMPESGLGDAEL